MTTPLRRQYLEIKQRYPHAILFFRMGDFYETFDEDAEVVARELEITLTSRPLNKTERTPLAGIPHHALDPYLAKLIAKGYRVAICEQTTVPEKGKKIVDREVVRVVTPGTVVEENLLDGGRNNYLAVLFPANAGHPGPAPFDRAEALSVRGGLVGLAHVDVSTGEFVCLQGAAEAVSAELERLRPAELLLPQGSTPPPGLTATLTPLGPGQANADAATQTLLRHFGDASLETLGLSGQTLAAAAAGVVLEYLAENQRAVLAHITRILPASAGGYMLLDANTRRNLEIFEPLRAGPDSGRSGPGSLLAVLDHTKTAMGARLLRKWLGQPLLDVQAIRERQDGVQLFCDSAVRRGQTQAVLGRMPDLERVLARISTAAQAALTPGTPRDLAALRRGLETVPELRTLLGEQIAGEEQKAAAERLVAGLHPCAEAAALIAAAIGDDPTAGSAVRAGFSEELDTLRATAKNARQYLADLERRERERTGIKSLKVGYNRVFGYYIEISNANKEPVPEDYQRKQTLTGAERYTTAELREHEYRVLHAQELEAELEASLLKQVCAQTAAHGARVLDTAGAVATVDVLCGLAEAAARCGYVRPVVDDSAEIAVRDGRHPVVERMLGEGSFVPNDIYLASDDAQLILLTGPNMAGKSTYLRQVAVIALMAQAGSFVPAAEARIGLVDRIYSRVGALDDIAAGHSTFMVEMLETATMLHGATSRSLLIFDEIGRGTSTYDGMAIARAVAEFIHNRPDARSRTLFATHYHELVELSATLPRVRNFNVAVAEEGGDVVFLHRILPGGADRSYGVHVAQLAGLPKAVVARAHEILSDLEAEKGAPRVRTAESAPQMSLFAQANDALRTELGGLDVNAMTPLEALNRLYELAERARRPSA